MFTFNIEENFNEVTFSISKTYLNKLIDQPQNVSLYCNSIVRNFICLDAMDLRLTVLKLIHEIRYGYTRILYNYNIRVRNC